jgi:hypothetical protein
MAKAPVILKLNGKPLTLNPEAPIIGSIRQYLDKAPADELFTVGELARKIGSGENYVSDQSTKPQLAAYTMKTGKMRYWGNPKAIEALRQQVAQ